MSGRIAPGERVQWTHRNSSGETTYLGKVVRFGFFFLSRNRRFNYYEIRLPDGATRWPQATFLERQNPNARREE